MNLPLHNYFYFATLDIIVIMQYNLISHIIINKLTSKKAVVFMKKNYDTQLPIVADADDIENLSLRELRDVADVVIKKGNKVTMQARQNNIVVKVDVIHLPASDTMSVTRTKTDNREALEETIKQQLKNGISQSEIALSVGLSQSSISRIKRKNTNSKA